MSTNKLVTLSFFTLAVFITLPHTHAQNNSSNAVTNSNHVTMNVTVMDQYGRYVAGLTREVFTVLDEKTPQEITFFNDRDVPITIGLLIDSSPSMTDTSSKRALNSVLSEAMSRFLQLSNTSNDYFVVGFHKTPQILLAATRDREVLLRVVSEFQQQKPKQGTALFDACYLGIEEALKGGNIKRAIIVISDGLDNSSEHTFRDLRRLQKASNVMIYSIVMTPRSARPSEASILELEGRDTLDELSISSGATRFAPRTEEELKAAFERIALEMRHQYVIGFKPTANNGDGKWHSIKVKIAIPADKTGQAPRAFVHTREGYYAKNK